MACSTASTSTSRPASSWPCSGAAARGKSTLLRSLAGPRPRRRRHRRHRGPREGVGGLPGLPAAAVEARPRQRHARPARRRRGRARSPGAGRGRPRRPREGLAPRALRRRAAARRRWPARWSATRSCCWPTSRSARSTRSPGSACTRCCASCARCTSRPCCWSPTTSTRRSCWPTASSCSTAASYATTRASSSTAGARRPTRRSPGCARSLLTELGVEDDHDAVPARHLDRHPTGVGEGGLVTSDRQLHLNLFIYPDGHHEAAWRHPDSETDRILDISYYQELAQRAEAAKFDAVFFADGPSLAENIQYAARFRLEPITVMTAIVAATERIGVIGTASTTYTEPYNLARQFAALDHLSKGRAGWNIVTTGAADAALNFGLDAHPLHARPLRAGRGVRRRHHQAVGQLGGRRGRRRPGERDLRRPRQDPPRRPRRQALPGRGAAQRRRARRRAGRSTCRPGRRRTAGPSPPAGPRRSSPRTRRSGSAQEFYADIKRRAQAHGPRPASSSRCCRASARSSGPRRRRPRTCTRSSTTSPSRSTRSPSSTGSPASTCRRTTSTGRSRARSSTPTSERSEGSRFQLVLDIVDREQPDAPPAVPPARRRARPPGRHRHARPGRRHDPGVGRAGAADGFNVMPPWLPGGHRGVHRGGRADPAPTRAVPHGVHRNHAARPPRPRAPRQPVRPPPPEEKTA